MAGSLQIFHKKWYGGTRVMDADGVKRQKWFPLDLDAGTNDKNDKKKLKNKREAEKRLNEILAETEQQKVIYSPNITFLDWIDKWLEQKKLDVYQSTYESYELIVKAHIRPYFAPLKLAVNTIAPQNIDAYYTAKRKAGLSLSTIKHHKVILNSVLEKAVAMNIVPYNVASRVKLPKMPKYEGKSYTTEQALNLLAVIDDEPLKPCVIFGLFYGLRRSEILGLRWDDVDFDKGVIHIRNTVVHVVSTVEAEHTKNEASAADMYIVPETKEYLRNLKRKHAENRLLSGASYNPNDRVCVWPDGTPFTPDYVSRGFKKLLVKNGLPVIRLHELRHTAGSQLLKNGATVKQVQKYLRHGSMQSTMIYLHSNDDEDKKELSVAMGSLLGENMLQRVF